MFFTYLISRMIHPLLVLFILRGLCIWNSPFSFSQFHSIWGIEVSLSSSYGAILLPAAWECTAWVRTYALFLEERLECLRILKFDVEAERLVKSQLGAAKVGCAYRSLSVRTVHPSWNNIISCHPFLLFLFSSQGHSRMRELACDELLEQLPALQQLLFRLIGCQVAEGQGLYSPWCLKYFLSPLSLTVL